MVRRSLLLIALLILCANAAPAQDSAQDSAQSSQQQAPADSSQAPTLALSDAVRIAQDNNRSVRNAVLAASIADDQVAEARTYRLPSIDFYALASQLLTSVDFTFKQGVFGDYPGVGPIPATDTSIHTARRPTFHGTERLSMPLSQQYQIGLNIKLAGVNKEYKSEQIRAEKQNVADQVKQAYYSILRTQSAIEVSDSSLELYREMDRLLSDQLAQEAILKADLMDNKSKLASEQYNNLSLHNSLDTQKENFNNLLGRDIRTAFSVTKITEIAPLDMTLEQARNKALISRTELRQAKFGIQQAELNRRITKSGYIPDVSLVVNNISMVNVNLLPPNVASAGVLISWNPLDWGRRKHQLAEGTKTIEQSRNTFSDTENKVLLDVGDKYRKFQQTQSLLTAANLALEASKERMRVVMNQYEQKAVLLTGVLQQKAAVQTATDQYQQALLGFWSAKADFEKALGED